MTQEIPFSKLATSVALSPQESLLKINEKESSLYIGVPKESSFQEHRVALTPAAVSLLVNNGNRVIVETKAGLEASFSDHDYSEVGAEIAYDTQQVFEAHIITKVAPPTASEVKMLKSQQIIFSSIHLPTIQDEHLLALKGKSTTSIAYEYIKDEYGNFPIVRALSEIAGSACLLIANEYLSSTKGGPGILVGGIAGVAPTQVVILGAGVVGEYATRTAMGLGASVKVFDNNVHKLMRLRNNTHSNVFTSSIYPEILADELSRADVVIGAIHAEDGRTPIIVSEEMIAQMKPGSIIIDVSIDQGGCFATSEVTSHEKPTFIKYDVTHYCVPNIASRVAQTASYAISNILANFLLKIQDFQGFENAVRNYVGLRNGVYMYKGRLTNKHLSERFGMRYTDLDLLMTAGGVYKNKITYVIENSKTD